MFLKVNSKSSGLEYINTDTICKISKSYIFGQPGEVTVTLIDGSNVHLDGESGRRLMAALRLSPMS